MNDWLKFSMFWTFMISVWKLTDVLRTIAESLYHNKEIKDNLFGIHMALLVIRNRLNKDDSED